jgi:putative cofactor-binding repeat protein
MAKKTLPQKRIFNLLKPFKPPATTWDKIYDWLINRARVIMVFAEIAVALSFVGKVVVDVQAKNLDDALTGAQRTLGQFSTTVEPEIRLLQGKADAYRKIWDGSSGYSEVLQEIHSYIPNPSDDIVVRIDGNQITIRGGSTLDELVDIEAKMRASETFSSVTLPTLAAESSDITAGEGKYAFSATIAGEAVRQPITLPNN